MNKELTQEQLNTILKKLESKGFIKRETKDGKELWQPTEKGFEHAASLVEDKLYGLGCTPTKKFEDIMAKAMRGKNKDWQTLMELLQ